MVLYLFYWARAAWLKVFLHTLAGLADLQVLQRQTPLFFSIKATICKLFVLVHSKLTEIACTGCSLYF